MSVAPNPPRPSLAVDQAAPIVREDPGRMGLNADSGPHAQDSSLSTDGPSMPKDGNFTDRVDRVGMVNATGTAAAMNEPEQKGELIEPKNDEDEDDEDGEDEEDDDDDFIPRGPPARPTGHLGATPGRPVKTR